MIICRTCGYEIEPVTGPPEDPTYRHVNKDEAWVEEFGYHLPIPKEKS